MSEPVDPHYPQPAGPPPVRLGMLDRMGARAQLRPMPRQGVSLAGVGVGLAVIGVVAWGGDFLTSGSSDARQMLGVFLSLAAVVVGYVLAMKYRHGPFGTAGVAASALGVPVALGFLTFDRQSSGLPVSLDAIVLVSVAAWLISYLLVPGARGHGFYLGLAAVVFWVYLIDKAEPGSFSATGVFGGFVPLGSDGSDGSAGPAGPDWTTVAILSLVFGLGYYLVAFLLDRSGRTGVAVPLVVAGAVVTIAGVAASAANLHEVGTGILLVVLGLALGRYGALAGRRFTTWTWALGVAFGVALIIGKAAEDNAAAGGIALILCGSALVVVGHLLTVRLHEPDDVPAPPIGTAPLP